MGLTYEPSDVAFENRTIAMECHRPLLELIGSPEQIVVGTLVATQQYRGEFSERLEEEAIHSKV